MQIWYFTSFWTVIIDFVVWFTIHLGFGYLINLVPLRFFNSGGSIYQVRSWVERGDIYQRLFRVKSWKKKLPDGASLFKRGFKKKIIKNKKLMYLEKYLEETCRAETSHWILLSIAPLFFLWNPVWAGYVNVAYALIANLPCIITQRYNRPHFIKLVNRNKHKKTL